MINQTILPEEKNNKYFLHNQRLIAEWEDFAAQYNGVVSGEINIYLLEFNLELSVGNYTIKIEGL